jgi:hypothetical protein
VTSIACYSVTVVVRNGSLDETQNEVFDDAVLLSNAPALAALALKQRLPSCGWLDSAIAGGLMAYGVSFPRHVPARGYARRKDSERREVTGRPS